MIVISAGVEAWDYPWSTLWGGNQEQVDDLPDPEIPEYALTPSPQHSAPPTEQAQQSAPPDTSAEPSPELAALPDSDTLIGSSTGGSSPSSSSYIYLGILKIPKLSLSVNLFEGAGGELLKGVGHVTGTALPDRTGNCAIGGHRNYIAMRPFRYLNLMEEGDKVIIKYGGNVYTYSVFSRFIVKADENWVMGPVEGEIHMITLITCDPVIHPVNRLIVWARLTDVDGIAPEDFFAAPEETAAPSPSEEPAATQEPESSPSPLVSQSPDDQHSGDSAAPSASETPAESSAAQSPEPTDTAAAS